MSGCLSFEGAKEFLNTCTREELQDHAFGDAEITWRKNGAMVAEGYIGGTTAYVTIGIFDDPDPPIDVRPSGSFSDQEARQLRLCGTLGTVERNDSTGPADYREGQTMPALTREGVRAELGIGDCSEETDGHDWW